MPNMADIVLTDDALVPTDTYKPAARNGDVGIWLFKPDPLRASLDRKLTLSTRQQANGAYRTTGKLVAPVDATLFDATDEVYDDVIVEFSMRSPKAMGSTQLASITEDLKSIIKHALVRNFLDDREGVF